MKSFTVPGVWEALGKLPAELATALPCLPASEEETMFKASANNSIALVLEAQKCMLILRGILIITQN